VTRLLRPSVALPAICLVVLIVNANILSQGFLSWDDTLYVTENPRVQISHLSQVWRVFDPHDAYAGRFVEYFPLRDALYALVYYAFGLSPEPYHIIQILLHLCVCLLLFACIRDWIGSTAALFATALFAVHPIHVESLAWISGLKDPLFSSFLLLSILLYGRYRRGGRQRLVWYPLSLVCLALSLACKSFGVVLPGLLLLVDLAFFTRRRIRDMVLDKIPYALVVLAALSQMVVVARANKVIIAYPGGSPCSGLLTMTTVFARYLGKLLAPVRLSARYVITPILNPGDPAFLFSLTLIVSLWVAAAAVFSRTRVPIFALGWITLCLLPVMNLIPIPIEMADRYLYFPSVGFCVLCGFLLDSLARRTAGRRPAIGVAVALSAGFALLSHQANAVWKNDVTLWSNVLRWAPGFYIGHNHLAAAYLRQGDNSRAREHLERSLALNPGHAKSHFNLGELFRREDAPRQAELAFRRALELEPGYAKALNGLGSLLLDQRQYDLARAYFADAAGADPSSWTAHRNLAMACAALGDANCAISHMEAAINLRPHDAAGFLDLMSILSHTGNAERALQWRTLLEKRFADRPALWLAWGKLAAAAGQPAAAREACARVIFLDSGNQEAQWCLERLNTSGKTRP